MNLSFQAGNNKLALLRNFLMPPNPKMVKRNSQFSYPSVIKSLPFSPQDSSDWIT